jgi:hypothetical protein
MIAAQWFLTVRWLMQRSAAMFLLGCPARTSFMRRRRAKSASADLSNGGWKLLDMHPKEACHDNYDDDHAYDVEDIHRLTFVRGCNRPLGFYKTTSVDIHSSRRRQTVG